MTEQTPTDAEILEIVMTAPALETAEAEWLHVCRAVLAKCGTPAPVGADMMALIDAYAEARHVGGCYTYNVKTAEARAKVVNALRTPQPTQAQAGAVPDEQLIQQMLNALRTCRVELPGTRFKSASYDESAVSVAITAAVVRLGAPS